MKGRDRHTHSLNMLSSLGCNIKLHGSVAVFRCRLGHILPNNNSYNYSVSLCVYACQDYSDYQGAFEIFGEAEGNGGMMGMYCLETRLMGGMADKEEM